MCKAIYPFKSKTLWQILKTAKLKIDFSKKCWDRIEGPEIYAYEYSQLTFDKGTKTVFSTDATGTTGHHFLKKENEFKHTCYILYVHAKPLQSCSNLWDPTE